MRNICIIGDFSDKDFVEDVFSALGWDISETIGKDTALIIGGGVDASRLPVSEAFCTVAAGPLSDPIGEHVQQCFDTGEIIRIILASYERKMRLVAVRGAGDLATGTIIRLLKAGYSVIATEIEQPTVIRRTVSFAEAVYDGKVTIEGVDGILASTLDEALSILGRGAVPILVDPSLSAVLSLSPEVLVDAAIAKRNLGTRIDMAPFVVALGPGFTAGVDADAVIETGIGGRLDATNTISPEAVFLTPIELEHTDVLGHTITAIAGEKAKIIRHSPVFISRQKEEAEDVFLREAEEMNAEVHLFRNEIHDFSSSTEKDGEKVSFSIDDRKYSLKLQMATEAMAENAALAVLGAARLGFLTDQGIMNLERMQLPGRFERRMIDSHLVVIDTAHTVNSVATTRDAFMKITSHDPVLIFGAVDGKDIEHMIRELFIPFRRIIISKPGSFKKSSPEKIFELAVSLFPEKDIEYIESPSVAFDSALTLSSDILITGSFYLAAEIERLRGENES